jgi:hypothetical protein
MQCSPLLGATTGREVIRPMATALPSAGQYRELSLWTVRSAAPKPNVSK